MRCRYAYLSDRRHYKLFRVFMASRGLRYDDWCETAERYIQARCRAEAYEENLKWVGCDADGKDPLWEKGFVATFELRVGGGERLRCVDEVLPETVPGSMVDWMWGAGCYEAYGFEMEF
ncbi:hypothetical protein TOPH_08842 [Tolypocladium ophioglossoides CBS 100239]|uniref:Uncharacterized protein n=1 Tax=Tolypocladium ophioglossoides (strain CBS 100239) TaxID=1163406 RepID=A0A0L0MXE9_TOLOC|nr:hypothetical protein TOPH_08842 [Tolypocladium ophioglossoides CBS 100239]